MNLKELNKRWTNRAIMIFEAIKEEAFSMNNITDQYVFFYSVLLANNTDLQLTFDEFIDELDNDPEAFNEFIIWLNKELEMKSQFGKKKEMEEMKNR